MNDEWRNFAFLGANTADGFYSLYDNLAALDNGDFLWVIKGGAGCGKSSFMRLVASAAEKKQLSVNYYACSGDPNSLDAIYIPALKTAYMDGTSPHVADVKLAAVNSSYLDLGRFYDIEAIAPRREELLKCSAEISAHYKKAYALLHAAGTLKRDWLPTLVGENELASAQKRVAGIIRRELGTRRRSGGEIDRRFFSAFSCRGLFAFPEALKVFYTRSYILESRLGISAPMLNIVAKSAEQSGYKILLVPDPLTPEVPEAVIIPALSLGFFSSASALKKQATAREIHLDARLEGDARRERRGEIQRYERTTTSLKNEAELSLVRAKLAHDKLEQIYNPYVDFDGVQALAKEHIKRLGLK